MVFTSNKLENMVVKGLVCISKSAKAVKTFVKNVADKYNTVMSKDEDTSNEDKE